MKFDIMSPPPSRTEVEKLRLYLSVSMVSVPVILFYIIILISVGGIIIAAIVSGMSWYFLSRTRKGLCPVLPKELDSSIGLINDAQGVDPSIDKYIELLKSNGREIYAGDVDCIHQSAIKASCVSKINERLD